MGDWMSNVLQSVKQIEALIVPGSANPSSTASGNGKLETYQEMVQQLTSCQTDLATMDQELTKEVPRDTQKVLAQLEIQMGNVYKFAVFIGGDFNGRVGTPDFEAKRKSLIKILSDGFGAVDNGATAVLQKVMDISEKNANLQASTLGPLEQSIKAEIEDTKTKIETTNALITTQTQNIDEQNKTIEGSTENLHTLVGKLQSAEETNAEVKGFVRGLLDGLTFGLAELGHPDRINIAPLEDSINDLQKDIQNTQNMILQMQLTVSKTRTDLNQLQNTAAALGVLDKQLPALDSSAQRLKTYSNTLQKALLGAKDAATATIVLIGELDNKAQEVDLVVMKQEYAIQLLKICQGALFDDGVNQEVSLIVEEIVTGYGGEAQLPQEVRDIVNTVQEMLKSPSPEAGK